MEMLKLKICDKNDINNIMELQREVIDSLDDKSLLRNNQQEMFLSCLDYPNLTLGLYDKEKLVALSIFVDARGTDEDLSVDLKKCQVEKCGNYKLIMVRKEYRGGLQKYLFSYLLYYANKLGFSHLAVTVSPDNEYSLKNILSSGFEIDHEAIKYGGNRRYVCVGSVSEMVYDNNLDYSLIDSYIIEHTSKK